MVNTMERGGEGGTVVYDNDGLPRDVFPLKMVSASPDYIWLDNLNDAIVKYSREREIGLEKRNIKKSVTSALTREEKSLRITIAKIERERGKQTERELLERKGNTILANLNCIRKGMTSVTLPDPYGTGEIDIELDPARDGPSNAERYFTRARKLKAAAQMAEERIARIEKRLEKIWSERDRLETLDDLKELKTIAAVHARKPASERTPDMEQAFPRRYTSVSGLQIIVGRNNRENDELVKWAHKNDFWFHAQGVGGSHVILRTPGKKQRPDRKSIEQAASIAAYYSKARTSAVVPVVCTMLKYVVKGKGQGPGKVTYTREKVIFAEPGFPSKDIE
jgi:predicted ribosome quality control (RQC) complex YloA/Tae2 family protein